MIEYNIVVCCCYKILVNVAAYVIPGLVCVWCGVNFFTLLWLTYVLLK